MSGDGIEVCGRRSRHTVPSEVLLFQTQTLDPHARAALDKVLAQAPPRMEVYLLLDGDTCTLDRDELPHDVPAYWFRHDALHRFKRPSRYYRNLFPGNLEIAVLDFWFAHPDYDFYWLMEYDVWFTGDWSCLFDHFRTSDSDLLATNLARRTDIPQWNLWKSLEPAADLPLSEQIRGFFPFYRASPRAFETLREAYRLGWAGHYECTMPTVLNHKGLKIEDMGGDGEFVREENINRFYRSSARNNDLSPGTFVFRPVFETPGEEANKLWHPVKAPLAVTWEVAKPTTIGKRVRKLYWNLCRRCSVLPKGR